MQVSKMLQPSGSEAGAPGARYCVEASALWEYYWLGRIARLDYNL